MENSVIEAGKYIFIKTTYNDISVLVEKSSGYYNATKICKDNGVKSMNDITKQSYWIQYTKSLKLKITKENGLRYSSDTTENEISIQILDVENEFKGTYIPSFTCEFSLRTC